MKLKTVLAAALAVSATSSAMAQTNTIDVTGATAFRSAAMRAITASFNTNGLEIVHDGNADTLSSLYGANKAIFRGTMPGITGTTIVRTSWNGSAEGLNAIAGKNNPPFYTVAALSNSVVWNNSAAKGNISGPTDTNSRPRFAFSDVLQKNTPVRTDINGARFTASADNVGVVTFAIVANDGSDTNLNNVTVQQALALWKSGALPLKQFTGNPASEGNVYAMGRNDGSGTRASYLSEFKVGVGKPVKQYIATSAGVTNTNDVLDSITLIPAGGTGAGVLATAGGSANASVLWGQSTLVGNGGYASSSGIRDHLQRKSPNTVVYDGVSSNSIYTGTLALVSWLSTADARTASGGGARVLAYNGVKITPIATSGSYLNSGFSQADYEKITTGLYSAWNFQQFYRWGTLSSAESTFRTRLRSNMADALGVTANGIPTSALSVDRLDDGVEIYGF
jgi:hypothetical protein